MANPQLLISRPAIADFCRRHHIKRCSLFGSATRADFDPQSDVDVMVEFEDNAAVSLFDLVNLQDALSELFGHRRVDIATPAILRNPYRQQTILRDIETLYAADAA